jgi:hypothetical protein
LSKDRPGSADARGVTSPTCRLITLRYPACCAQCERPLPPGSEAWWDQAQRTATCLACKLEAPPNPFCDVDDELRGTAGGSAQEEADRKARAGHSRRSTEAWEKGSDGERRLSDFLHEEVGRGHLLILDDRRVPGTKANIDLVAIAPSGVYVVDAKHYDGKVEVGDTGFGRWRRQHLIVKGRDRTPLVDKMEGQVRAVRAALDSVDGNGDVPVYPVVSFVGAEWDLFCTSFTVNGVQVMAPRPLRRRMRKEGSIGAERRAQLARLLSIRLLPAVAAASSVSGSRARQ